MVSHRGASKGTAEKKFIRTYEFGGGPKFRQGPV